MAFTFHLWIIYLGCYLFVYGVRKWAETRRGEPFEDPELASQKRVLIPTLIWMACGLLLTIFVPIALDPLFFIGLAVGAVGLLIVVLSFYSFAQEPGLTTTGIHRLSRNPNYVGWDVFMGSLVLMGWSGSLILNLLLLGYFMFTVGYLHYMILLEERFLLGKYGEEYRDYLEHTPRYFGLSRVK